MIDFRYHIVSLISVFLALAVGIALGAGPLKDSIGDTLTGQVDQLRSEKDALRVELDRSTADLTDQRSALAAVAPDLVDGILPGRRVAVIEIGEVTGPAAGQVVDQLTAAGATVTAHVVLTAQWTDTARASFRGTLAGTLVGYLDPAPAADAGTGVELAEALVQALSTAAPTDPDTLAPNASVILDLLAGDAGMITTDAPVTVPADAVVILAGPIADGAITAPDATTSSSPDPSASAAARAEQADVEAAAQVAQVAQVRTAGVVLAGEATADPGVLHALRSDVSLASTISTVDSVQDLVGQVAVPMALSARITGIVGQYGLGDLATAAMPKRIELKPIERIPSAVGEPQPAPTAGATQG